MTMAKTAKKCMIERGCFKKGTGFETVLLNFDKVRVSPAFITNFETRV